MGVVTPLRGVIELGGRKPRIVRDEPVAPGGPQCFDDGVEYRSRAKLPQGERRRWCVQIPEEARKGSKLIGDWVPRFLGAMRGNGSGAGHVGDQMAQGSAGTDDGTLARRIGRGRIETGDGRLRLIVGTGLGIGDGLVVVEEAFRWCLHAQRLRQVRDHLLCRRECRRAEQIPRIGIIVDRLTVGDLCDRAPELAVGDRRAHGAGGLR